MGVAVATGPDIDTARARARDAAARVRPVAP
jgi:phosphoribosylglycinamide formyltransferase 2